MNQEQRAAILQVQAKINKEFGIGAIAFGSETNKFELSVESTGSLLIDKAIGVGGLARGRMHMLWGKEDSGKTTVACCIVAGMQERGLVCAYLDPEPLEDEYAESLGVDLGSLIRSKSEETLTGEQYFEIMRHLIRSQTVDLIVVDSVAAMIPQIDLKTGKKEKTLEDKSTAALPGMLSACLKIINGEINMVKGDKPIILFLNEARVSFGAYIATDDYPGGRKIRHACSYIGRVQKIEKLTRDVDGYDDKWKPTTIKEVIGNRFRITCSRTKLSAPPFPRAFNIYNDGIDATEELIAIMVENGEITPVNNGRFEYKGKKMFMSQLREAIENGLVSEGADDGTDDETAANSDGGSDDQD